MKLKTLKEFIKDYSDISWLIMIKKSNNLFLENLKGDSLYKPKNGNYELFQEEINELDEYKVLEKRKNYKNQSILLIVHKINYKKSE